jgi:hypothetical protein
MGNLIYRLFLAFNSTYLIVVVYLIKEKYYFCFLDTVPYFVSRVLFVLIPIILTALSFALVLSLGKDKIGKENIAEIELANNSFLPTYLGYFFVSLSVNSVETLIFIFSIIYIFTFLSQTLYFNPIFLLFGYHFYFLTTTNNVKIFLISRKRLKKPQEIDFNHLRINDYTFIEPKNN